MTELLKRKQPLPWKEGDQFCNVCLNSLTLRKSKKYGNFYWCPHCKDWRYPECYDLWTKKRVKVVLDALVMDTNRMKEKIDQYEVRFLEKVKGEIITYSCNDFDQEFLKSLVPKK